MKACLPGCVWNETPRSLSSLESNAQLSFATRVEDWTCLGQHKRQPEFPVVTRESRRNSRKTTWLPRHRKMKPFPATEPQEKSHFRNWRSKGHLAPLMRPTKFPEIPVSLGRACARRAEMDMDDPAAADAGGR